MSSHAKTIYLFIIIEGGSDMRKLIYLLGLLSVTLLWSCTQEPPSNPNSTTDITSADIQYHINYLASDELEGREAGSKGAQEASAYIANEFKHYGLQPAGENGSYFHEFEVIAGVNKGQNNKLTFDIGGEQVVCEADSDFSPVSFSENGTFTGGVVFAGYGIEADDLKYNDYDGLDVKDKIVLLLRYSPEGDNPHSDFNSYSALRRKASLARDKGAAAVIIVTGPNNDPEDALMTFKYDGTAARAGVGVANITGEVADKLLASSGKTIEALQKQIDDGPAPASFALENVSASLEADVRDDRRTARNVAAILHGNDPSLKEELIILGAHFDHLGYGGSSSLDREATGQIHNGADDNASGSAGLLELAQKIAAEKDQVKRSYLFLAFSAEEMGLLGSSAYVKDKVTPMDQAVLMINMDMIGRMKENQLILYGLGTSPGWEKLVDDLNAESDFGFELKKNKDGTGPSDHSTFYQAEMPVLALFTGIHSDYHKPSDDADKINVDDEARIVKFAYAFAKNVDELTERPQFTKVESTERRQSRGAFRVYVGTIPDYAETDVEGLKLSGVSSGSPAEKIGLQAGDVIIKFGPREVKNIYDYTYALQDFKPGDEIEIVAMRGAEKLNFMMTLEARR